VANDYRNIVADELSKGCGLWRGELPGGTNQVNGVVTVRRFHLSHDSAYMILHCELGQIQVCCDFLIRQAVSHQPDELELPWSEGLLIVNLRMRWLEFLQSLIAQMSNQRHAKARRTSGFAADCGTHRGDDLCS
jgi:hypothetical protein